MFIQTPLFGVTRKGHPDLFRFPRFLPICSDLRFLFFRGCPDLFRFAPFCFQNKSEQIRETPFCRPLLQIPDLCAIFFADFLSLPRFRARRALETLCGAGQSQDQRVIPVLGK